MSDERRKRQDAKQPEQAKADIGKGLIVAVLVAGAFLGAFYLGKRKRASRLDSFAQCLADKQVQMYGLYWCTHCAEQKEMFGSSFKHIPYIECGIKGSRAEEPVCVQAGVKEFPAWQFASGERHSGVLSIQALSEKSGCSLP